MGCEPKVRKVRNRPAPYTQKKRTSQAHGDTPKSAAQSTQEPVRRKNLTLADWLIVFGFIDEHPDMSQTAVVEHFSSLSKGALKFTQSTLSRKLEARSEMQERVETFPAALSSSRPRVVTRPDVEKALFKWVKHMEGKGETVTGPMLMEKRRRFEKEFDVPEAECLSGPGWIGSFKKAYGIKEHVKHGEAGSVDLDSVEKERVRIRELLAQFKPEDRFNADETGLFAYAPPDRGLATQQMSGKKLSKFRLTIMLACNATGSEKREPMIIGKPALPRCFNNRSAAAHGFYYRNNKRSWMKADLFEEWIQIFDLDMRRQNRRIILLVDNFSAHYISYEPTNIVLIYFSPNLTAFLQPLDAGVIRDFKALYRKDFCLRALDLDDADEADIFKINQLEAMHMVKKAWRQVTAETIAHCWRHTQIQRDPIPSITLRIPVKQAQPSDAAWGIIIKFAGSDMTLPEAEDALRQLLGDAYIPTTWAPALKAVMDAEGDEAAALSAVEALRGMSANINASNGAVDSEHTTGLDSSIKQNPSMLETELMDAISELRKRNRIHGQALSLDEVVNPREEYLTEESEPGIMHKDASDADIVAEVRAELEGSSLPDSDGSEAGSDDEDDESPSEMSTDDIKLICTQLETVCLQRGELHLSGQLRKLRGQLTKEQITGSKQVTLDSLWSRL